MDFNRLLVLSPHPDDGELGAGGTIARFVEEGKKVYYIAFSTCEIAIPSGFAKDVMKVECRNSTGLLGIPLDNLTMLEYEVRTFPEHRQQILQYLVDFNERVKPDLILVPSSNDTHQDHQTIHNEALRAFKKTSSIWGYEHPWNNLTFTTDIFVKLDERHLAKKISALKHYESQDYRPYLNERYITALAYTRGTEVNFPYAETFELVRLLVQG